MKLLTELLRQKVLPIENANPAAAQRCYETVQQNTRRSEFIICDVQKILRKCGSRLHHGPGPHQTIKGSWNIYKVALQAHFDTRVASRSVGRQS